MQSFEHVGGAQFPPHVQLAHSRISDEHKYAQRPGSLVNTGLARDNFSVFLPSFIPHLVSHVYSNSNPCLLYLNFVLTIHSFALCFV